MSIPNSDIPFWKQRVASCFESIIPLLLALQYTNCPVKISDQLKQNWNSGNLLFGKKKKSVSFATYLHLSSSEALCQGILEEEKIYFVKEYSIWDYLKSQLSESVAVMGIKKNQVSLLLTLAEKNPSSHNIFGWMELSVKNRAMEG